MMKVAIYPLVIVIALLFLNGCKTEITKKEIVPEELSVYVSTGKNVVVLPVVVRAEPKPGFLMDESPTIDGETYGEALIKSLQKSSLFSSVNTHEIADFSISAEIIGQRIIGSVSNVSLFLVRYELINTHSEETIWSENIFSHHALSAQDVFMGAERQADIIEGASRDNISQLIDKLGVVLKSYVTPMPSSKSTVAPKTTKSLPVMIEKKVIDDARYPHKLTGNEIKAHFKRYKHFTFENVPKKFTLKIVSYNNIERVCEECGIRVGVGFMKIKVPQDLACFYWDNVSYPQSTCFEVIQIKGNNYNLVTPNNGKSYLYKAIR